MSNFNELHPSSCLSERLTLTDTSRPPAPPGAWAPPSAYSGYGAQQQQVIDDRHDIVEVIIMMYITI